MKKIIIALLVAAILVSAVLICLPMNTKAEETSPWAADGSDTPGHANYDHKTVAEFAADLGIAESAVTVITNYTEYCAITSGTAEATKYYLLDLSADDNETLELTGKNHFKNFAYIYVDFNGYSVDVSGDNNGAFMALHNATIKNLKMVGTRRYVSDRAYYSAKKTALAQSPLTTQGYNSTDGRTNGKNGVVHLDNVFSECTTTITQQHGYGKEVGGIISYADAGSTFKRCVNNGNITVVCDDVAIEATKDNYTTNAETGKIENDKRVLGAQVANFGGIVGYVHGASTFEDCINTGALTIDESKGTVAVDIYGASGENVATAGIVAYVNGNASIEGCTNRGNITTGAVLGKTFKHIAGVLGRATGLISLGYDLDSLATTPVAGKPCYNYGTITSNGIFNVDHQQPMAGLAGSCYGGARAIGCVNYGNAILNASSSKSATEQPFGGILGNVGGSIMHVENCRNEGNFTDNSATPNNSLGGIVGKLSTDAADNSTLTIKNCTNKGTMTGAIVGGLLGMAEDSKSNVKIISSGNSGNIIINKMGLKKVAYAGGHLGAALGSTVTITESSTNTGKVSTELSSDNDCYLGGFVGYVNDTTKIEDSSNEATIEAPTAKPTYTGGIIGAASATITLDNCVNNGAVTGQNSGGIVGGTLGATVITGDEAWNSKNTGNVAGSNAGGAVGTANAATTLSYLANEGAVNTANSHCGGAVGYGSAEINVSYFKNTGNITGKNVGGVVATTISSVTTSHCVNSGTLKGTNNAAGMFAYLLSTEQTVAVNISDCVNIGNTSTAYRAGGMFAYSNEASAVVTITNCINGEQGKGDTKGKITVGACDDYGGAGGMVSCFNAGSSLTVKGCTNFGNVEITGAGDGNICGAGGIIGTSKKATTIGGAADNEKCYNYGTVTTNGTQGAGIIGYCNQNLTVTNAVNMGDVTVNYNHSVTVDATAANKSETYSTIAGGIVGYTATGKTIALTGCENHGSVTANGTLSGKVTTNKKADVDAGTATKYTANVTMNVYAGGIIPYMNHSALTIDSCNTYDSTALIKSTYSNKVTLTGDYNTVTGYTIAGGITGEISKAPTFNGNITNENSVDAYHGGGIAGYVTVPMTYENFTNKGNIKAQWSGGIIGWSNSSSTFNNCTNLGNITGVASAGGIAGYVTGTATVSGCVNGASDDIDGILVKITNAGGTDGVAGIIGYVTADLIMEGCTNYGAVSGDVANGGDLSAKYVGGLVARAANAAYIGYQIENATTNERVKGTVCCNYGTITANIFNKDHTEYLGGILGESVKALYVANCINRGNIVVAGSHAKTTTIGGAGGIVGVPFDAATGGICIESCSNYGNIINESTTTNTWGAAGIVGRIFNEATTLTVKDCHNYGNIYSAVDAQQFKYSGGIVGYAQGKAIVDADDCTNAGAVDGLYSGGIIGVINTAVVIEECNNESDGHVSGWKVGGILGYGASTVGLTNCHGNGDVTGLKHIGGLIGYAGNKATVTNCTLGNSATVTATGSYEADSDSKTGYLGGLLGQGLSSPAFTNCTANGNIVAIDWFNLAEAADAYIAGITGHSNGGSYTSCTNNALITVTHSGVLGAVGGIVGRNNATMSLTDCVNNGIITVNTNVSFLLTNDGWAQGVGGILGNGGANTTTYTRCTNNAAINVYTDTSVGGIMGYNANGKFAPVDCRNNGAITVIAKVASARGVGGIIGLCTQAIDVKRCINDAPITVEGTFHTGGIVGWATAAKVITDCENTANGDITFTEDVDCDTMNGVGGIMGYGQNSTATVTYCVNNGSIIMPEDATGYKAYLGGIVGRFANPCNFTVRFCTNNGRITGQTARTSIAGGIVSLHQSWGNWTNTAEKQIIEDCVNTGRLSASRSGGIVGTVDVGNTANVLKGAGLTLRRCVNTGNVFSVHYSGGMVGLNGYQNVTNSDGTDASTKVVYIFENCANLGELHGQYLGGMTPMVNNVEMTITGCISAGKFFPSGSGECNFIAPIINNEYNKYDDTVTNCYYLAGTGIGVYNAYNAVEKTAEEIEELLRGSGAVLVVFDKADIKTLYNIGKKSSLSGADFENAMAAVEKIIVRGTVEDGERTFFTITQYQADVAYETLYALLYPSNFEETFDIYLPVSITLSEGLSINLSDVSITPKSNIFVKVTQEGIADGENFKLYMIGDEVNVMEFCFVDKNGNEITNNGTIAEFNWSSKTGTYNYATAIKVDSDMPGKYKGKLTFTVDYISAD